MQRHLLALLETKPPTFAEDLSRCRDDGYGPASTCSCTRATWSRPPRRASWAIILAQPVPAAEHPAS